MRVGDAARQVGTSARMLRYAEQLGLVDPPRTGGGYRHYGERDLRAAALALELQVRYGVAPAALAFGLRALEDPEVGGSLRRLAGLRGGRPGTALDFETAKARRLLRLASWHPEEVPALDTLLKDPALAPEGLRKIDFAAGRMPVL